MTRTAFNALPDDAARDATIGRLKDGTRLDLAGQHIDPHDEPADVPAGLPPTSHVRKAGPRGVHDDIGIFRRGLPFTEVFEGHVQVGLHFASFQANPEQFETVFRDWLLNPRFPDLGDQVAHGSDALLVDPIVNMQHAGMFFVPPHVEGGLTAALAPTPAKRKPKLGRLVISKRVTNPADPSQRFERGGFTFHVVDNTGAVVAGSDFTTASSGRGVCPVKLEIGRTYTVVELTSPMPVATMASVPITISKANEHLRVQNQVTQPGSGYGARG